MLIVMPGSRVSQKDLARIMKLRAQLREDAERLRSLARDALGQIEAGAKIEGGVIPAKVDTIRHGGQIITRLLIDNQPADEV